MKCRTKSVEVEAFQLIDTESAKLIQQLLGDNFRGFINDKSEPQFIGIEFKSLEETITMSTGDWLIKDISGRFSVCTKALFTQTYEIVPEQN